MGRLLKEERITLAWCLRYPHQVRSRPSIPSRAGQMEADQRAVWFSMAKATFTAQRPLAGTCPVKSGLAVAASSSNSRHKYWRRRCAFQARQQSAGALFLGALGRDCWSRHQIALLSAHSLTEHVRCHHWRVFPSGSSLLDLASWTWPGTALIAKIGAKPDRSRPEFRPLQQVRFLFPHCCKNFLFFRAYHFHP